MSSYHRKQRIYHSLLPINLGKKTARRHSISISDGWRWKNVYSFGKTKRILRWFKISRTRKRRRWWGKIIIFEYLYIFVIFLRVSWKKEENGLRMVWKTHFNHVSIYEHYFVWNVIWMWDNVIRLCDTWYHSKECIDVIAKIHIKSLIKLIL